MLRRLASLCAVGALVAGLAACGDSGSAGVTEQGSAGDMEQGGSGDTQQLTAEDDGSTVETTAGTVLSISLDANPPIDPEADREEYGWRIEQIDEELLKNIGAPQAEVAPGTVVYWYETLKPGVSELSMSYAEHLEPEAADTFSVTIDAKAGGG